MRDRNLAAVCEDYLARVRRHLPVEVIEVESNDDILRRIPVGADVIALEPGGETWDTAKLTAYIEDAMVHGRKTVAFLIGGSDGLSKAAVARASRRLSLSPMTLPHRLARVIVCEQIYRALSIIKGEPYSR
ncbi:MAG: 23S rRNA (pseudouridine(1915)-N(3))-methyltransferase RlmH [Deltaproteobacteria bacterium]|nr:23S rRNA (pseudouridine(1915)-N(3))-methyltransferase RlmH [Deltaproteobacteria bacterium]